MSGSWDVGPCVIDIKLTLENINYKGVKTGSICSVPEKIREANKEKSEEWYRPKFVAMGPIHRGAIIGLRPMELTKWRYTDKLLSRLPPRQHQSLINGKNDMVSESLWNMKGLESIIRACYGDTIPMGTEEFAKNMFVDACFLVELLLRLYENDTIPSDLDDMDEAKISRLLTDLMLLENQVPFLLLKTFSLNLFKLRNNQQELVSLVELSQDNALSPKKLAESLFGCNVARADFPNDVYHFLHLIYLCSPDPYQHHDKPSTPQIQLHRCARKLQALGITITAGPSIDYEGNINEPGTVASALREFMDKFEFEIKFNEEKRELIIPTLHIKEATEVRWRNFIAWEQIGGLTGVGYKFTSYAYFFKGLVCSAHDVQILRVAEVIQVQTEAKDKDLLIMFQSIGTGAKLMDGRYTDLCKGLNEANVKDVAGWCKLILIMAPHNWRRFLGWLQRGLISMLLGLISMLRSFIHTYLGTPWRFIGVLSGTALLVLTIMQTIYAARSLH